jgi:hypothetical protein
MLHVTMAHVMRHRPMIMHLHGADLGDGDGQLLPAG